MKSRKHFKPGDTVLVRFQVRTVHEARDGRPAILFLDSLRDDTYSISILAEEPIVERFYDKPTFAQWASGIPNWVIWVIGLASIPWFSIYEWVRRVWP